MILIGNQDHDDICLFGCGGWRYDLQAVGFRLLTALAFRGETYNYIAAVITHIESVGMALAAVADNGYSFHLQQFEVGV